MSALLRRSRSKTAPEHADEVASTNGTVPTSNADLPDPSALTSPTMAAAPELDESLDSTLSAAEMLSNLPTSIPLTSGSLADVATNPNKGFDEHPDNRSSSLSELGDASDEEQSEQPTPRASSVADTNEADSEAETERLENTPRKLKRTATDTSMASEQLYERTPSKLIQSTTVDEDDSPPSSPIVAPVPAVGTGSGNAALDTLSFLAASEAASLEIAGKKRKRSSAEGSSADEPTDAPARKRSSTIRDPALNGEAITADSAEQVDLEEELDNAEERIEELAQEEAELEQRQADVAAETVNELATVAKLAKPRKGGRRGKRKLEDAGGAEAVTSVEPQDAEIEEENEEEDSAARDEEAAKKKNAIEELAKIERKFKIFREKLCDEQIAQCELELEMLKQPNCTHPEYLAMIQCIDERRIGKIAYEKTLLEYKQNTLMKTTNAERHQLHSQYFQTLRDLREDSLSECNQRVYELQRGRRQLGIEEVDYSLRLAEKRSEQIRQQTAYNLEVSILSGVAKHVGFPAAPEIRPARPSEIDDDLRAMKITTRPAAQPVPYVRPTNYRNTTADEAAAEEQFIERTPWANPQHPAHQQAHYTAAQGPPRATSQSFQTPAGQRRMVDLQAPNGSASTIDANSNPPSSAAGQGLNGRIGESESPVMQMKRNPSDHPQYNDTPGSGPRYLPREPLYANMLSSPATQQAEDPGRIPGRPLNAGPPPVSANVGRQVPLTQRSGLGTVSVGSGGGGGGLFGR